MIAEITNPLPTIFEILDGRILNKKLQDQTNTLLTAADVAFNRDPTIIEEFAKETGLEYYKAEIIAIQFFEQIKQYMMTGSTVFVERVGAFYAVAPTIEFDALKLPTDPSRIYPKFRPAGCVKRAAKEQSLIKEVDDYVEELDLIERKDEIEEEFAINILKELERKSIYMNYDRDQDDSDNYNGMENIDEDYDD